MGQHADDLYDLATLPQAWCDVHRIMHQDDEWGCPMCENGDPPAKEFRDIRVKPHRLRKYQRGALAYTVRTEHPSLLMGMRLGKNAVTIRRVRSYTDCKLCLIVCPNPAFRSWKRELVREGEGLPIELVGTRKQRGKALAGYMMPTRKPRKWYIINKHGWISIKEIASVPWDVLIIDEKIITDPTAKVTQFFLKNFRRVKHRWILSGKLAPESETQYICPLWFTDPRNWGYAKDASWKPAYFYNIRDKYFKPWGFEWRLKKDMEAEWRAKIAKAAYIVDRKDVKLGGLIIHEQRTVQFPEHLRHAYTKLEKSFVLEINGKEIARTIYAPGKHTLFRRLCGGYVPGAEPWTAKLEELCSLLRGELKGEPAIICAMFTEEIDAIETALAAMGRVVRADGSVVGAARDKAEEAFQTGKADWFLCHPACYQYGAELHRATTMIFFSSPESLDMREQMENRMVDLTKQDSLLVIDMPVEDTIEEDIITSLLLKEGREDQTRRIVKRMQKHVATY